MSVDEGSGPLRSRCVGRVRCVRAAGAGRGRARRGGHPAGGTRPGPSPGRRERDKRAASVARAEKAATRLGDLKAELRKARKATEKSAAKLQREHDARERAEQGRAEWKQRAKALDDELQAIRETLTLHETRLETATIEVEELRAELRQATHDQRAAVDEAARQREQLLRLHTELGGCCRPATSAASVSADPPPPSAMSQRSTPRSVRSSQRLIGAATDRVAIVGGVVFRRSGPRR